GMWRDADTPDPVFTDTLELDMGDVKPSLAGPKRPQDRVLLSDAKTGFADAMEREFRRAADIASRYKVEDTNFDIGHGDVVIAAITSCTNT
ncbi:aconitase family protein, partial [Escherichia coli]